MRKIAVGNVSWPAAMPGHYCGVLMANKEVAKSRSGQRREILKILPSKFVGGSIPVLTNLGKRPMKTVRKQSRQQTFRFTLILSGLLELSQAARDALFESGCDDALLGMREGKVFLDFDRKAASFRDALLSAIGDVERAGIGAQIVRVEPLD